MPSFDVVSKVDMHELTNAVDQTNREVTNRFDFKGTDARVEQDGAALTLHAESEFQLNQMKDILHARMAKRGVDVQSLEENPVETAGSRVRQRLAVREGIDKEFARKIVKMVKETKLKVQAAIQGDQVRVSGKKRDELQQVIASLREQDFDQPLQFENFRE